jgi:uncharacterized protein YndB with AHSA1/START domain
MPKIVNTVLIRKPPETVFDYLVDLRNELKWNPGVEHMEMIGEGPIRVGTKFNAKWKSSAPLVVECVKYDRPHSWAYHNGGPVTVDLEIGLTEHAEGTTLVSTFNARPNGLFRLIFPLFFQVMKREEKKNMGFLKQAVEALT